MPDTVLEPACNSNEWNKNVGQISLRKILYKKEALPVIHSIINAIGAPVTIEDAGGSVLLTANEGSDDIDRYPYRGIRRDYRMG